jgi:cell division septal protein FtsQ
MLISVTGFMKDQLTRRMQIRINHKNKDHYSPLHEAKPLNELDLDASEVAEDHEEDRGWRASQKIVAFLFLAALLVFGFITIVADEFRDSEKLTSIRVEGNRAILTSEIFALAKIDRSQKFYDIDLRSIEGRIEKHPVVRRVVIEREVNPNALVIRVEERQPRAMIIAEGGEPAIIDGEYKLFWPRRLSGLQDPDKLLSAPMLSGVSYKDSTSLKQMTDLVTTLQTADDGAMHNAIGELKRTPTGAFILYTSETMTPIYLGAPEEDAFHTALETEQGLTNEKSDKTLFERQLALLSALWKKQLRDELRKHPARYIDARYDGQIIVKTKTKS